VLEDDRQRLCESAKNPAYLRGWDWSEVAFPMEDAKKGVGHHSRQGFTGCARHPPNPLLLWPPPKSRAVISVTP
jgi:hypothetical protein